MDTHEVIARFEAERQALALMDHPNIARVFDGGTTVEGEKGVGSNIVRPNICGNGTTAAVADFFASGTQFAPPADRS